MLIIEIGSYIIAGTPEGDIRFPDVINAAPSNQRKGVSTDLKIGSRNFQGVVS